MWKVLRRHQGLQEDEDAATRVAANANVSIAGDNGSAAGYMPPSTAAQAARLDRFTINQRSIAQHGSKPQAAEAPADVLTAPYGNWVYGKILVHATHENVVLRRRAYSMLLELFAQRTEHAVNSLNAGAMKTMVESLKDADEDVRGLACMALQTLARTPRGQEIAFEEDHFPAFLAVLDDESPAVVAEGLRLCYACHLATNEGVGTQKLIQLGCIQRYVEKVGSPDEDVCATALTALGRVFDVKEAFIVVNDEHAIKAVTKALKTRRDTTILVEAAEVVSKAAFYSAGKRAAVLEHTVEAILPLITHDDAVMRTAATGAVVALTISEDGKLQAIGAGIVERLMELLQTEEERDVLANAVKTVCNISEHPLARQQLVSLVPRLQQVASIASADDHGALKSSVERAIAMIMWKPGDVY
jgi:hypothetical protein